MSRNQLNNPTARILRLLDSFAEHEAYILALEEFISTRHTDLTGLPPRPSREHFAVEITRQQLLGHKVERDKQYARRMRAMEGQPKTRREAVALNSGLSAERKAEIDAILAAEGMGEGQGPEQSPSPLSPQFDNQKSPQEQGPNPLGEVDPINTGDATLEDIAKGAKLW